MTQKEQTESRIVYDKMQADKILRPENGEIARPHAAYPYLNDLLIQMKEYMNMDDADRDTCCMIFEYAAEQFTYVPYLPSAVECYTLALKCAENTENSTVLGEIPDLVYKIAKYRNMIARDRYVADNSVLLMSENDDMIYDKCEDIDTKGKMKTEDVRTLVRHAAVTAKRSLIADPAEHTPEYAELIFDMNETLFGSFDSEMQKSPSFAFAFWAAKKSYLANHGIAWQTPAALNPSLRNRSEK